jgi:hypothetical protein
MRKIDTYEKIHEMPPIRKETEGKPYIYSETVKYTLKPNKRKYQHKLFWKHEQRSNPRPLAGRNLYGDGTNSFGSTNRDRTLDLSPGETFTATAARRREEISRLRYQIIDPRIISAAL